MTTEFAYGRSGMFLEQVRPASSCHWQLDGNSMAIGRDPSSTIYVEDISMSRHHADLVRHGRSWSIVDARSTNGTFVNNRRVNEAILQDSDRIRLGQVEFVVRQSGLGQRGRQTKAVSSGTQWPATAQLESSRTASDNGNIMPARSAGPAPADIRVDRPIANEINIAEKQYRYFVQQRDSFLREVAATKTKARWLVWTGFLAFAVGFGLFAFADLSFLKQVNDAIQNGGQESPPTSPFGREIGGVPIGLIGWALGAVGMMLLIVGIILHIVATSRRRRVEREFPLHPPWQGPSI